MKKFFSLEILFVIFAFALGLILMFITPPFQSADESGHFAKTMALANGNISPVIYNKEAGNFLPKGVLEFQKEYENMFHYYSVKTSFKKIKETRNIFLDKDKAFVKESYIAMYSPLSYLPQAVGAFIGMKIFKSVYWVMIISKLSMLLFYIYFGYLAIRSAPFLKQIFFLVLLTPMSLSLGASVSADAVLISVCSLFIAKILQFSYKDDIISKKELAFLCVCSIFIALVKQSFLMTLFVLFIPRKKFGQHYFKKLALILLPALTASILWANYTYQFFVPCKGSVPKEQIKFIFNNPIIYIQTLTNTLKIQFRVLAYSFIGLLGWFNVAMAAPVMKDIYWIFLFLNSMINIDEKDFNTKWFQKLIWALCITFNFLFICTAIYASWNEPYRTGDFEGLQGRYFIPVSIPFFIFLFFLINKYTKISKYKYTILIANCIVIIGTHISMALGILNRFY